MRIRCDITVLLLGICLIGLTSGCRKKVAVVQPAPPPVQELPLPAPKAPAASITAEPSMVEPDQPVTLNWSSTDATEATISGLGSVAVEGRQEVRPAKATTYELVAKGPGGSATASVTVNVMAPPPPIIPPPAAVASKSLEDRIASELSDVYFDYDKSGIREDAIAALAKDAEALEAILADFPAAVIVLEGHCDERGSAPQWRVEVNQIDAGGSSIAPEIKIAIYENLVTELTKSKQFSAVLRSGDSSANGVSNLLILKTTVVSYAPGSETKRAVTTVTGATKLKVRSQLCTRDGQVVLERIVDGNVRFFGGNLRATHNLARNVVKAIKHGTLPEATPSNQAP